MLLNFKFWYKDGQEEDLSRDVDYIPDQILYKDLWWKKSESALDFDDDTYSKIHYREFA
jgi:hypothetical protein